MKFLQRFWYVLIWLFGASAFAVFMLAQIMAFIICIAIFIGCFFAFLI